MTGVPQTIHVINLDTATSRWEAVKANVATCIPTMTLNRFRAIPAEETRASAISGRSTWSEKACYLSHVQCLLTRGDAASHLWIAEDDMVVYPHTLARVERALAILNPVPWDILFTQVQFGANHLTRLSQSGPPSGELTSQSVAKLGNAAFFGTSSYLVNAASVRKVQQAISLQPRLNLAWDMFLKWCSAQGLLDVFTCIPSATGVMDVASQIERPLSRRLR